MGRFTRTSSPLAHTSVGLQTSLWGSMPQHCMFIIKKDVAILSHRSGTKTPAHHQRSSSQFMSVWRKKVALQRDFSCWSSLYQHTITAQLCIRPDVNIIICLTYLLPIENGQAKEKFHHHWFQLCFIIYHYKGSNKPGGAEYGLGHISFWSMLMMLICCARIYTL
jgi:hypothetical protein